VFELIEQRMKRYLLI